MSKNERRQSRLLTSCCLSDRPEYVYLLLTDSLIVFQLTCPVASVSLARPGPLQGKAPTSTALLVIILLARVPLCNFRTLEPHIPSEGCA